MRRFIMALALCASRLVLADAAAPAVVAGAIAQDCQKLEGLDKHQRLIDSYKKLHTKRATVAAS